jgi:hypothetical protein
VTQGALSLGEDILSELNVSSSQIASGVVTLSGDTDALNEALSTSGAVQYVSPAGLDQDVLMTVSVSDDNALVEGSVALQGVYLSDIKAEYNNGRLRVYPGEDGRGGLSISRSDVSEIRLSSGQDVLDVVKISEGLLRVVGSDGADHYKITLDDDHFDAAHAVAFTGGDELNNDQIKLITSAYHNSALDNVLGLGKNDQGYAAYHGSEEVVWDDELELLTITGDKMTLNGLENALDVDGDGVGDIDLGAQNLLIDAQEVTIVGNIYAKNITLDVSEKLDLHGKLIADEGPAMLTGGARVAFGGAPSSEGTLDVSEA